MISGFLILKQENGMKYKFLWNKKNLRLEDFIHQF